MHLTLAPHHHFVVVGVMHDRDRRIFLGQLGDSGAELDVHLRLDVGVDGQQIVRAADGDAVTGIEEYGDVGALGALAEVEQLLGHLVAGEVGAFDDLETDALVDALARVALREDAGLDRPDPGRLGRGNQPFEQQPSHT